jgi:NADPH-dependent 2,4-dienoyl-CoA reductase/sulfur reductase-like enzyme
MTAADTIRRLREDAEIVLLTEEAYPAYSRTLLPDYIAGKISFDRLLLKSESYYKNARISLRLRTKVKSVRPEEQIIITDTGESISFDRLLIACGGTPKLPAIDGINDGPTFTLKTIDDARHIMATVRKGCSVIVLAQDLVGVEITRAFCQMGMQVTYLEWDDDLLPHILDPATAEDLAEKMRRAGVKLVLGEVVRGIGFDRGKVTVQTGSRTLDGDALAVAIGKTPELGWLRPSGIMINSGIIADERLRTNFPSIYAAGDVTEIFDPKTQRRKLLFGWKNAVAQGRVAGANMCGEITEFEVNYIPGLKQIFGVDVRHRWK